MSERLVTNRALAAALMKRGLVPEHCTLIDVQIGVDGGLKIRYERFVPARELVLFAEALQEVAADMVAKP